MCVSATASTSPCERDHQRDTIAWLVIGSRDTLRSHLFARMTSSSPTLDDLSPPNSGVVRGACPHDCPDTCAMLVTVEDGRAVRVAGDPDHPVTRGFLCAKVNRYVERTYHEDRVRTPLRRVGPKGSRRFEAISWDDALTEIAVRLLA